MNLKDQCQKCGVVDEDVRTLWHSCFYAMEELGIPFSEKTIIEKHESVKQTFYTLRVCKDCRADWMNAIKSWFNDTKISARGCGSGIFIRENGRNVEITREEWNKINPNPNREPFVIKP